MLLAEKDIQSKQLDGLRNKLEQMKQHHILSVNGIDNKENLASNQVLSSDEATSARNQQDYNSSDTDNTTGVKSTKSSNQILNDVSNNIDESSVYMNESYAGSINDCSKVHHKETGLKINSENFLYSIYMCTIKLFKNCLKIRFNIQ